MCLALEYALGRPGGGKGGTVMARTIWKFPLSSADFQSVEMPRGAKLLGAGAQNQGRDYFVWAEVDPMAPTVTRHLSILGTGWNVTNEHGVHVATFQAGPFVWHLYDAGEKGTP